MGEDVQFTESGSVSVSASERSALISTLTPGTTYSFTVVANTAQGQGQESTVMASTAAESDGGQHLLVKYSVKYLHSFLGRLGFFQIKFGPVSECFNFLVSVHTLYSTHLLLL